jgi:hypothetical protein
MPKRKPTDSDSLTSTNPVEIETLIGRVKHSDLPERDAQLVERLLRLVLTLVSMLEHKNASISRLKRLLFVLLRRGGGDAARSMQSITHWVSNDSSPSCRSL